MGKGTRNTAEEEGTRPPLRQKAGPSPRSSGRGLWQPRRLGCSHSTRTLGRARSHRLHPGRKPHEMHQNPKLWGVSGFCIKEKTPKSPFPPSAGAACGSAGSKRGPDLHPGDPTRHPEMLRERREPAGYHPTAPKPPEKSRFLIPSPVPAANPGDSERVTSRSPNAAIAGPTSVAAMRNSKYLTAVLLLINSNKALQYHCHGFSHLC